MASGYNTAQPNFNQDFIYQPPWELVNTVLSKKQQEYDNALTTTELFKNAVNINNLDFDSDAMVGIKDYYNGKIDEITSQIKKDPNSYQRLLPQIRSLGKELEVDKREGVLSKIEGRYNDYAKWRKDNEIISTGDTKLGISADPNNYNAHSAYLYNTLRNATAEDINAKFSGDRLISRPNINTKDMRDIMDKMKASAKQTKNGMYLIDNKWLSEQEVQQAAWNIFAQNPEVSGYAQQQARIGDPSFYNKVTGQPMLSPFKYTDSSGNEIDLAQVNALQAQYANLSNEEKTKTPYPINVVLNDSQGYAQGLRGMGQIFGFSESTLKADEYGKMAVQHKNDMGKIAYKGQIDSRLQGQKDAAMMNRIYAKGGVDSKLLEQRFQLMDESERKKLMNNLEVEALGGNKESEKAFNALTAKESFGVINPNNKSYEKSIEKYITSKDSKELQTYQEARNDAKKKMGKLTTIEDKFLNYLDKEKLKGNSNMDEIVSSFYTKNIGDESIKASRTISDTMILSNGVKIKKPESIFNNQVSEAIRSNKKIFENLGTLGDNYEKMKQDFYNTRTNVQSKVTMNPVTTYGSSSIVKLINSASNSYYSTDKKGNILDEEVKPISKVLDAFGANPKETLGIRVEYKDGEIGYVFPKKSSEGGAPVNTLRNLLLDNGLKYKNSTFDKELSSSKYSELKYNFERASPDREGNKKIIYSVNEGLKDIKVPIHYINGNYYIVNPNNPKDIGKPYNDLTQIIDEFKNIK